MFNSIDQLEKREKLFLLIGIIVILIMTVFYGLYQPYHHSLRRLDKKISARQLQLKEVRALQTEYQALQKQADQVQKTAGKKTSRSPLARVEGLTSEIAGRDKLSYIRPQPPQLQADIRIDNLDIKLEKLSFEQVLQLFWKLEGPASQMQVKNFRLKQRFDNASELDLTITISLYSKNSI